MAQKRARKPSEPRTERKDDLEAVFSDVLEPEPLAAPPAAREEQEEAVPVGIDEDESAFAGILGTPVPRAAAAPAQEPPHPPPEEASAGTVDGYIRDKVLREMYGTGTPSEHDRILLAIKRLL
jgi:hypothetical protein